MAQKVNPIAVRLNFNRFSDSSWFSDYYYSRLLYQDLNFRQYLSSLKRPNANKLGFRVAKCIIHHFPKKSLIHLFCLSERRDKAPSTEARKRNLSLGGKHYDLLRTMITEPGKAQEPSGSVGGSDRMARQPKETPVPAKDLIRWPWLAKAGRAHGWIRLGNQAEFPVESERLSSLAEGSARLERESPILSLTGPCGGKQPKAEGAEGPGAKKSSLLNSNHAAKLKDYWAEGTSILQKKRAIINLNLHRDPSWEIDQKRNEVSQGTVTNRQAPKEGTARLLLHSVRRTVDSPLRAFLNYFAMQYFFLQRVGTSKRSLQGVSGRLRNMKLYNRPGRLSSQRETFEISRPCGYSRKNRRQHLFYRTLQPIGFPLLKTVSSPRANVKSQENQGLQKQQASYAAKGAKHVDFVDISKSLDFYLSNVRFILSQNTSAFVSLRLIKVNSVFQCASLVAQEVACKLEQKKSFRLICRLIFQELAICSYIKGIRISCSGRLNGAEIAKTECRKFGETSLHVFSDKIDYARAEASTPYGILGVKVWISYI